MKALRRQLLAASVPITKAIGRLHAPYTHKRVSGVHVLASQRLLRPGHVLMSRTRGELTNLFIPGFWSHGAIYVGDGFVAEAIGEGVVLTDIVTFMTTKDAIAICAPLFASDAEMTTAAAWAREQRGKKYDFEFTSGNDAFYCFELTYAAYHVALGGASPWELRSETMGVPTVLGDDIERARDKWRIAFDTRATAVERIDGVLQLVPLTTKDVA